MPLLLQFKLMTHLFHSVLLFPAGPPLQTWNRTRLPSCWFPSLPSSHKAGGNSVYSVAVHLIVCFVLTYINSLVNCIDKSGSEQTLCKCICGDLL